MGNAHLDDILLRLKSSGFIDHSRMKWRVLMTDPVSGETYHFESDCHEVRSYEDAYRRAYDEFNRMWSPQ